MRRNPPGRHAKASPQRIRCRRDANLDLTLEDIPLPSMPWREMSSFALSFDGYEHWGSVDKCADIANARPPVTLTELRTCLFFEQPAMPSHPRGRPGHVGAAAAPLRQRPRAQSAPRVSVAGWRCCECARLPGRNDRETQQSGRRGHALVIRDYGLDFGRQELCRRQVDRLKGAQDA